MFEWFRKLAHRRELPEGHPLRRARELTTESNLREASSRALLGKIKNTIGRETGAGESGDLAPLFEDYHVK